MVESDTVRSPSRARRALGDLPVDLRSDTVTRPTPQMRAAMAAAEVGDDVLDGDPTLRELEARVAGMLGTADALWTPSGTMGNLIALMSHLRRGDAFLAPEGAHVLDAELGTAAWLAGGMPRPLPHDAGPGRVSPGAVRRAAGAPGPYFTLRTTLLCLENTHNASGGSVTPPEQHAAVVAAARGAKLAVHLDGARLWNAAVALGVPPAALTVGADTVQVCLSKGLGAPVGSVVAGSAEFVEEARRLRKMLGGGIRQGGVLGAAGLLALDRSSGSPRTTTAPAPWPRGCASGAGPPPTRRPTSCSSPSPTSRARCAASPRRGCGRRRWPGQVRLMTHADLTDAHITAALERIGEVETGRTAYAPAPRNGASGRRPRALQLGQPGADGAQLGQHGRELLLGALHVLGDLVDVLLDLGGDLLARAPQVLHEPARDRRGHHAEQGDPGDHQRPGHDPALERHRVAVAVADGGDRRDGPPHRVPERGDGRALGVALGVQHGQRRDEPDQRHRGRDVHGDAPAHVVAQLAVEHADDRDHAQRPELAEHRQQQDRQVEQVRADEPPPPPGQGDPDRVVQPERTQTPVSTTSHAASAAPVGCASTCTA
jgi:threonine aldolase